MARKKLVIQNVTKIQQSGTDIFMFPLPASVLVEVGVPLRFGEHPEGINRRLTNQRAKDIARFLKETTGGMIMTPIRGDLRSGDPETDWRYDAETATLSAEIEVLEENQLEAAYIIIDDGQHRQAGAEMCNGEDRAKWTFVATVTKNLPKRRRIEIFQLEDLEKRQDPKHMMAQRQEIGQWRSVAEQTAYLAGMALNQDRSSPLRGKIHFKEGPVSRADKELGVVSFTSILSTLKPVAGHDSNIHGLEMARKIEIVVDWFRAAATVWPGSFGRPDKALGKPIGYCALLRLLSRGRFVHALIARDYSAHNIVRVLGYGRGFKWETGLNTGTVNHNNLAERLDTFIRDAEERSRGGSVREERTGTDG